jgi:hypothetical protein
MSHTSQTRTESDYTRACSDASVNLLDRSVVTLHVPTVNATSLGTAIPVSSPWFHQEAVVVMGLIRFIYLFSDGPHPGARMFR